MRRVVLLGLVLVGCAPPDAGLGSADDVTLLPEVAGPPPVVVLDAPDEAMSGDRIRVRVSGAPPGTLVSLMLSNGVVGQGRCPPTWRGVCLGFTAGGSGYKVVDVVRADAAGTARFPMIVPVRAGQPLQLQAVVRQRTHVAVSNVETMDVTRTCVRDAFEPDDRPREASWINAPQTGLVACSEGDMFRVDVPAGAVLETVVTQDPADGDVDVEVLDERGVVLDVGATVGSEEITTVWQSDVVMRTFYVRVFAFADPDGEGVPYSIDPIIATKQACVDDAGEPDDVVEDGLPVGVGDWSAVVCPTDEDHRVWDAPPDVLVALAATTDASDGSVRVDLYADGLLVDSDVGGARWATTGVQAMDAVVTVETDDVLQEGVSYTLTVEHQPIVSCGADLNEDDDDLASATVIAPGIYDGATGCLLDDDWYGVVLASGDRMAARISFDARDADLDLYVHGPAGRELFGSATTGSSETVEFRAPQAGTYFLRVTTYEDLGPPMFNGAPYQLELRVP